MMPLSLLLLLLINFIFQ